MYGFHFRFRCCWWLDLAFLPFQRTQASEPKWIRFIWVAVAPEAFLCVPLSEVFFLFFIANICSFLQLSKMSSWGGRVAWQIGAAQAVMFVLLYQWPPSPSNCTSCSYLFQAVCFLPLKNALHYLRTLHWYSVNLYSNEWHWSSVFVPVGGGGLTLTVELMLLGSRITPKPRQRTVGDVG